MKPLHCQEIAMQSLLFLKYVYKIMAYYQIDKPQLIKILKLPTVSYLQ